MQQNWFVIGLEHGINGILLCLVIFCHLGVHSQPPGAQQFLPSLDSHSRPTRERCEPLEIFFPFSLIIFGVWSHGHPQPNLAKSHPLGSTPVATPCSNQFFTSIQCLCSQLYLLMHAKIEFTARCHPTFSRSQNVGFLPFWAIFANFAEFLYWFGSSHQLSKAGSRLTPPHTITKLSPLLIGMHGEHLEH